MTVILLPILYTLFNTVEHNLNLILLTPNFINYEKNFRTINVYIIDY